MRPLLLPALVLFAACQSPVPEPTDPGPATGASVGVAEAPRPKPNSTAIDALRQAAGLRGGDPDLERLEELLTAAVARPDIDWAPALTDLLHDIDGEEPFEHTRLPVLTALRRVEGRPDPLQVEITRPTGETYVFPELPVFGVRLLYAESETETFRVQIGGNYRSGRLERWAFLLEDADGRDHPGTVVRSGAFGGGVSTERIAGPGFAWGHEVRAGEERGAVVPVPLPLRAFRQPESFGRFTARAVYSDWRTIASDGVGPEAIVFTSEPVEFTWEPRRIVRTVATDDRVSALIDALVRAREVTVSSSHLPSERGLDAPDAHPLAQLYAIGYEAVPELFAQAAVGEDTVRKAHAIAALYSLTGLGRPGASELGPHVTIHRPMPVGSGVRSNAPVGRSTGRAADLGAQSRWVADWESRYLANFEIVDR